MGHDEGKNEAHIPQGIQTGLALGALGVVFGDIGTSPLYTMQQCLGALPHTDHTSAVLGILSLIFWSLTIVVSVKYLGYVMYVDNRGEGGVFAMLALLHGKKRGMPAISIGASAMLILTGAALLYGDGFITPSISVLSASEGLKDLNPELEPIVIPAACLILGCLFYFQHKGTGSIGRVFGPIMLVWFFTLGAFGGYEIIKNPTVLWALSPHYGLELLFFHPGSVARLLGAVVLAVTGTEALYADMGHFGKNAIRLAWYTVALPGLLLSYFGQGAWALAHETSTKNPFFAISPEGPLRYYLVILGIVATIIASQALISGTYSLTRQGILLGYFPRLPITHTSSEQEGQIYIPFVNWTLAVGCILLVLGFRSSDALADAYGTAVTGTMVVTTLAFYLVTRRVWGWNKACARTVCGIFLVIDLAMFGANLTKFLTGGWFPLAVGFLVLAIMYAWKKGRAYIANQLYSNSIDPAYLIEDIKANKIPRLGSNAVFMTSNSKAVPIALLHHLKVNECLHKYVILLTIITDDIPYLKDQDRVTVEDLGENIYRLEARFGFMEIPDVPTAIRMGREEKGMRLGPKSLTYYFNRELVLIDGPARLALPLKILYRFLSNNASPAKDYFCIPASQIVEMGLPVKL